MQWFNRIAALEQENEELIEFLRAAFLYQENPFHKEALTWEQFNAKVYELMEKYDTDFYERVMSNGNL